MNLWSFFIFSQEQIEIKNDNVKPGFINIFSYGYDISGADLGKRYGGNFHVSISPTYYFNNTNFSLGINADFLFGYNVKINPFDNLITFDGQIINTEHYLSALTTSERGYIAGIFASKIFPFQDINKRHGIRLDLGVGYMSTWIRFKDELGSIPQLEGEYLKGYDRMSNGWALKEFIGYQYLKKKSKINFTTGFEFLQGFTKSIRGYNYDLGLQDNENRLELLFGVKIGWILPIYIENSPEEIYY